MLTEAIERFLSATGTTASRFGRRATGDPRLVFDLRRGRMPREETVRKINAMFKDTPNG